jgi:hypothetical protein
LKLTLSTAAAAAARGELEDHAAALHAEANQDALAAKIMQAKHGSKAGETEACAMQAKQGAGRRRGRQRQHTWNIIEACSLGSLSRASVLITLLFAILEVTGPVWLLMFMPSTIGRIGRCPPGIGGPTAAHDSDLSTNRRQ